MSRFNLSSRWTFVLLFALFSTLITLPALAQLSTGQEGSDDEDSGEILIAKENAVIEEVDSGPGWFQVHISDAKNPNRGVVSDLLFVTPEGIDTLPLSEAEKEELLNDFGLGGPKPGTGSKGVAAGSAFSTDDPYDLFTELQKPASAATPNKVACDDDPPATGGGFIIIDLNQLQVIQELKALHPNLDAPDWQDPDQPEGAKGCFGWNDKNKTKNWNLADNSISENFDLGGGFTGSYQVQLPFQTAGSASLKYRVKKFACVPYKFRFKSVNAQGTAALSGTASLSASASLGYTWEHEQLVFNPKIASVTFWVGVIPVWVDFYLPTYVGVKLDAEVSASVSLDADFGASGSFEYTCTSDDCCGDESFQDHFDTQGLSSSLEAEIGAQVSARVGVKAAVWNNPLVGSLFYGEAGVKGFVGADVWGYYGNACGDGDGDGHNETVEALVADAEAGFDWVFGIGGALSPEREWTRPAARWQLGYWDLLGDGGSTALSPMLIGPSTVEAGQTATYTAKMRPCYPYTDAVNLNMGPGQWIGTPQITKPKSSNASQNSTQLSRAFSQGGVETLSLTATTDAKGRELGTLTERALNVTGGEPIDPRRGSWYNPSRSGNGISFYSNNANYFVLTWYTYTASGAPIWYVSDTGLMSGNTWSQPLYRVTMNSSGTTSVAPVGQVNLDFSTPEAATFSWTLNGQSGSEPFIYLRGGAGRTGLWYPPSQSGWGLDVSEHGSMNATIVSFYDAGGQPTWVLGAAPVSADATLQLDRYYGPGLCPSCSGTVSATPSPAGSMRLQIQSGSSTAGVVSTTINSAGTIWNRTNIPIAILTTP